MGIHKYSQEIFSAHEKGNKTLNLVVQVCKKVPQHIFIRKKQLLMFATMHRVVDVNYYYKWQTDMGSVQELMGHGLLDVEEAPVASGIDQNLTIDD